MSSGAGGLTVALDGGGGGRVVVCHVGVGDRGAGGSGGGVDRGGVVGVVGGGDGRG